jgi:hypothetical protein
VPSEVEQGFEARTWVFVPQDGRAGYAIIVSGVEATIRYFDETKDDEAVTWIVKG